MLGDEDNNTGDGNLDKSGQKLQKPIIEVLRSNPKKLKDLFDPSADSAFDVLFWWMTVRYFPDIILLIH